MFDCKSVMAAVACSGVLVCGSALAEASGPDFFNVSGVSDGSVLNIRAAPSTTAAVLATIPANAQGIANLGCEGGLSLAEWETATDAEKEASRQSRWCRVGFDRTIGWAAGQFLVEGSGDSSRVVGGRATIAGSEWGLRDFAGRAVEVEAWVAFKADNAVTGNAGCNNFNGSYNTETTGAVFSPLGSTRMLCPQEQMDTELRVFQVMEYAQGLQTFDRVMALFGGEGEVLATFTQRDAD